MRKEMPESENEYSTSRARVSHDSVVMRAVLVAAFLLPALVTYGQNSIDRIFLKVEQHSAACTLDYIAEDKMYTSFPQQLTVSYNRHFINSVSAGKMKVILPPITMALKAIEADELRIHDHENEGVRFSAVMGLVRIDAPYSINSVIIKNAGGKMIYIETEIAGHAFTLDLSGFNSGFYTMEIIRKSPARRPKPRR